MISGKEYTLLKIFSSDFEYHIPAYQRPYAWTTEEASTLFNDLYEFYTAANGDDYFLGSIVLIKEENKPYSDVIDGQQRLTTLTIMFSVIASLLNANAKASCMKYLQEEGDILAGIPAKPRMHLRNKDQEFFNSYIQNVKIDELIKIDSGVLDTEAKIHIKENAAVLLSQFKDTFETEEEIIKFTGFMLNRCFLVSVSTESEKSAFRVFSVMNSRGLDLLPVDIIKSEVIGEISEADQDKYTEKWENLENETTREGFNEVFTHTRTIFAKEKQKKALLEEFREYVVKTHSPTELIDSVLTPYSEAYIDLKRQCYTSTSNADEINYYLYWMNKIDNYDWMPVAIKFLAEHRNESSYFLWFIKKLERLAAYLQITAQDINSRVARYKWIISEMDTRRDHSESEPLKTINLTSDEKKHVLSVLDGDIYAMPSRRRNYILQRLDSFVSDGGAKYEYTIFTIEHVLPQNPGAESDWLLKWPDQIERKSWTNKIANLVPLTRKKNSQAQNKDFAEKKVKYFQTQGGGTVSYALTSQVVSMDDWTPDIVKKRQQDLLNVFINNWQLEITDSDDDINLENGKIVFHLAARGCDAHGYASDDNKFTVKKASIISFDEAPGFNGCYADLRHELIENGVIKENVFTEDYSFDSVSAAAAVCCGRRANGQKEWTTIDGRQFSKVI